jgi:hypothetical protein
MANTNLANFICVLFGTRESYFDSKFKFLLIRISRDHISLQYKRIGLTQAFMPTFIAIEGCIFDN